MIPDFELAEAKMTVQIRYIDGIFIDDNAVEDYAEQFFKELQGKIKKNDGFPLNSGDYIRQERGVTITWSCSFNENTILGKILNNEVIVNSTKAEILVYMPKAMLFKIAVNATEDMLKNERFGFSYKLKDFSSNPYVEYLRPKYGNAQLTYESCKSSFRKRNSKT